MLILLQSPSSLRLHLINDKELASKDCSRSKASRRVSGADRHSGGRHHRKPASSTARRRPPGMSTASTGNKGGCTHMGLQQQRELNERKLHQSSKISSQDTRQPSTQEFCHAVCRPTAGPSSCSRIDFSDPSAAKLSPAHDADAQHQSSSIEKDPGVEKEIVAKPVTRKEDTPEGRKTPDTDPSQARECKILGQRQDGGPEEGFSDRQADLEGFVVSEKASI